MFFVKMKKIITKALFISKDFIKFEEQLWNIMFIIHVTFMSQFNKIKRNKFLVKQFNYYSTYVCSTL